MRAGIQHPRVQAWMATVQPDRIGAGFRTSEKMQCSKPSRSSICTLDLGTSRLGNLRGAIGLFGWRQSRF